MISFKIIFLCSAFFSAFVVEPKEVPERTDENGVTWIGPIRKCPLGNDSVLDGCAEQILKDLTPLAGAGIEELGLGPMDPIEIKKFSYERSFGPVNISLVARNTIIRKLSDYKILKFKVDSKNIKMSFIYEVPRVLVESNYKLGGSAFLFPVTGSGPAKFEIFDLKAGGEFIGKINTNAEGRNVIQVEKTSINNMSIRDMNLSIVGLFDGDKLLSSAVHFIGKRYANLVFEIFRPAITEFAENMITHEISNPLLEKLPYLVDYIPTQPMI